MDARTESLKDIKVLDGIKRELGERFPEPFVHAVFNHLKANREDAYDHSYLLDSLSVANTLMRRQSEFTEDERRLVLAIVMLVESGHPVTSLYPYDVAPGVAWYFLRTYANGLFNREEEHFISQNCRPVRPLALRLNPNTRVQLVVGNTKKLTDIVNQNYKKIYDEFVLNHNRLAQGEKLKELFWDTYGPKGNIWEAISDSAKGIFASEIALFKREVGSIIEDSAD